MLGSILKCISDAEDEVRQRASLANDNLLSLIKNSSTDFISTHFVNKVTNELVNTHIPTRIASLRWISILLSKTPEEMINFIDTIYSSLLNTLSDDSDVVGTLFRFYIRIKVWVMGMILTIMHFSPYLSYIGPRGLS
jgi:hypothetical protein